jgi:uncharacterized membrane protein
MTMLVVAALAFILLHLLVSGTRVRDALTGVVGEGPYTGLFSLASVALLAWMAIAFGHARGSSGDTVWWGATTATRWLQLVLQLIAFFFIVVGLTTRNPTSVRQEGAVERPVRGMLRITRHPFLWGVAIWALGHLIVAGDLAGVILFVSLAALALFGTASIDAKRKRALGERWDAFAAQTSNVPFAAIAAGRQKLSVVEIGWWRIALAIVVWVGIYLIHPMAFGVSPKP